MKVKSTVVVLLALALLFSACGNSDQAATASAAAASVSVAMVTDVGGVNDKSFNQSAWEGLQKAETDLSVKVSYKESKQESDYAANFNTLIDEKPSLIWGIGFLMGDALLKTAKENPSQNFAIIDMAYDDCPANVVGVVFKAEQSSFLVGYIAGKMSKTGKVGFVGGMHGTVIDGFEYGYKAGVMQANPKATVISQYADSFTDAAKGKAIALSMYQQGCDVIFHAAGNVGAGVIEVAKEQNKWVIGVDKDQHALAPNNVITSAVKRVDMGVYNVVKSLVASGFTGGTTIAYGLAEGGVDIAPTSSELVPAEILAEVETLKQKIIAGTIVVPFNADTFKTFTPAM
jgi:basic membrane protein A and related proteins